MINAMWIEKGRGVNNAVLNLAVEECIMGSLTFEQRLGRSEGVCLAVSPERAFWGVQSLAEERLAGSQEQLGSLGAHGLQTTVVPGRKVRE